VTFAPKLHQDDPEKPAEPKHRHHHHHHHGHDHSHDHSHTTESNNTSAAVVICENEETQCELSSPCVEDHHDHHHHDEATDAHHHLKVNECRDIGYENHQHDLHHEH
jgi:hypothetical protein